MMNEKPTRFVELKPEHFPVAIELFNREGKIVRSYLIEEPGVLDVPGLAANFGPVGARVRFANGEQYEAPPPSGV